MATTKKPRGPRMYQPIWRELLKKESGHKVELSVLPMHVARVKKAVIKEKLLDTTVAFLNREEGDNLKLYFFYNSGTRVLTVQLKQTIGIEEIKVK